MINLILIISLIIFTQPSYASTSAEDVFGWFKGLHEPFINSPHPELSPIHALDRNLFESLRMHAHQSETKSEYERPISKSIDTTVYPQTAFAALLERTFTSHVGLLANSDIKDPIHKWLKPHNIGLMFNVIYSTEFYDWSWQLANLCLAEAFMPVTFGQLIRKAKKQNIAFPLKDGLKFLDLVASNSKIDSLVKFLNKSKDIKAALSFAGLLRKALEETKGKNSQAAGLPQNCVEHVLLAFMCEKKAKKADLLPFYQAISDKLLDKNAVRKIIWSGKGSFFTKQDYWAAKKLKAPLPLEISKLLRLGFAQFEDRLPPEIYYGISHVRDNNTTLSFSDCGETSLLYLLMALLFDPDLGIYDWERLEKLRENGILIMQEAIEFFRKFCSRPAQANSQDVRNKWATIIGLLNYSGAPNTVEMLHPGAPNSRFGINAGIHNIFAALGNILNDPLWNKPEDPRRPIQHKLNRLCTLFSPSKLLPGVLAHWDWELSSVLSSDIAPRTELEPDKRLRDSFNTRIILKLRGHHVFEWQIQPQHFDFLRANPTYNSSEAELNSKAFSIPENITEETFPRYLYNSNLRTVRGKLIAINKIYWFKNKYQKACYDLLLKKWLDRSGKHLGYFGDFASNEVLLRIMTNHGVNIDDIFSFNVPKLTAHLFWMKVRESDIQSIEYMLKKDIEMLKAEGEPYHNCEFTKVARITSVTMIKANKNNVITMLKAGLEEYYKIISKRTAFSIAILTGQQETIQSFAQLDLERVIKLKDPSDPSVFFRQFFGPLDETHGFLSERLKNILNDESSSYNEDSCKTQ